MCERRHYRAIHSGTLSSTVAPSRSLILDWYKVGLGYVDRQH
jgi:hypothetical protein